MKNYKKYIGYKVITDVCFNCKSDGQIDKIKMITEIKKDLSTETYFKVYRDYRMIFSNSSLAIALDYCEKLK